MAACDNFIYFDVLNNVEAEPEPAPELEPGPKAIAPALPSSPTKQQPSLVPTAPRALSAGWGAVLTQSRARPLDQPALDGLRLAISKVKPYNDDEWVNLADLGSYLGNLSPNLHFRNYGYDRLRDFVLASGLVEVKAQPMGKHPPVALAKLKRHVALPIRGVGDHS